MRSNGIGDRLELAQIWTRVVGRYNRPSSSGKGSARENKSNFFDSMYSLNFTPTFSRADVGVRRKNFFAKVILPLAFRDVIDVTSVTSSLGAVSRVIEEGYSLIKCGKGCRACQLAVIDTAWESPLW